MSIKFSPNFLKINSNKKNNSFYIFDDCSSEKDILILNSKNQILEEMEDFQKKGSLYFEIYKGEKKEAKPEKKLTFEKVESLHHTILSFSKYIDKNGLKTLKLFDFNDRVWIIKEKTKKSKKRKIKKRGGCDV